MISGFRTKLFTIREIILIGLFTFGVTFFVLATELAKPDDRAVFRAHVSTTYVPKFVDSGSGFIELYNNLVGSINLRISGFFVDSYREGLNNDTSSTTLNNNNLSRAEIERFFKDRLTVNPYLTTAGHIQFLYHHEGDDVNFFYDVFSRAMIGLVEEINNDYRFTIERCEIVDDILGLFRQICGETRVVGVSSAQCVKADNETANACGRWSVNSGNDHDFLTVDNIEVHFPFEKNIPKAVGLGVILGLSVGIMVISFLRLFNE